jgi:UrcA family protein
MITATAASGSVARIVAALSACLIIGVSATAHAASNADAAPSVRVTYSDLNVATEQGAQALYGRIVAAARQVCPDSDIRNLAGLAAQRSCEAKAVAHAVQQVHSPKLAATYMAHTRQG